MNKPKIKSKNKKISKSLLTLNQSVKNNNNKKYY